jgi:hypothetical protein
MFAAGYFGELPFASAPTLLTTVHHPPIRVKHVSQGRPTLVVSAGAGTVQRRTHGQPTIVDVEQNES